MSCWRRSIEASCQRVSCRRSLPITSSTGAESTRSSRSFAAWRSGAVTRGLGAHGQAHGRPSEARQPTDEHAAGRRAVERGPGAARQELDPQSVLDEARVTRGVIDRLCEHADLVVDRSAVGARGGIEARGEEPQREAAKATYEPGAGPLAACRSDGGRPVVRHAEVGRLQLPLPAARHEADRDGRENRRTALEQRARTGRRQSADVDSGDLRSRRELVGGAREGVADPERDRRQRREHDAGARKARPDAGPAAKLSSRRGPLRGQRRAMVAAVPDFPALGLRAVGKL